MSRKTEVLTALGTVTCAVGIGFVMQNTAVNDYRYGSGMAPEPVAAQLVGTRAVPFEVIDFAFKKDEIATLDVQEIEHTSAKVDVFNVPEEILVSPISASLSAEDIDDLVTQPEVETVEQDCSVTAHARPDAAAMVMLKVDAPCYADDRITVSHEGISFSERVDENGLFETFIPALSEKVRVKVAFMDGETAFATTEVDSVALYDRVVLRWEGQAGVQIHAREFDADYGTEGHVWSGAPRSVSALTDGRGGFLTSFGDDGLAVPKMTEVYTFPADTSDASHAVSLSVETEVTEMNCGKRVYAQSIQYSDGIEIFSQRLNLPVPDCSTVGSFLVLNNLVQNLKVAQK